MLKSITITFALALSLPADAAPQEQPAVVQQQALTTAEVEEAQAILERLVEDYRTDPMAIDGLFGIKLADQFWTVEIARK